MGVRFYDKENMSSADNYATTIHTSCNCNTCNQQTTSSSTTTSTTATQTISTSNSGNNFNFQKSGILREIVGNRKEMRIEYNSHNLRIVGNNNRIRITLNVGDITIIGNNTRLKIKTNNGNIKYTGNDGRISLGKDSTEQLVDYSGCNGVLKVQSSKKSTEVNDDEKTQHNATIGSTSFSEILSNSRKSQVKYASYCGSPTEREILKCHNDYSRIFHRKKSMPNIKTKPIHSENVSSNCSNQLSKSIVHSFGNVVIANSSNICISPYSYIY